MKRERKQLDSVLVKPAGPDCNLACRYCFYLEKQRLFADRPTRRMSDDVLEALVRQVMSQPLANVAFGWQGGEPTLMGVEFFRRAIELEKRYGRDGQTVGNGLQTNGLLVDDQWCRLLREARFLVGLSLDGPERVHDRYRVSRGGQPTWKRVTDSLKRMLDHGVEVNALAVVNDYSARFPREIYEFHKQVGLRHMQFIPCLERSPDDPSSPAPFSALPQALGEFLCKLFDCWQADFRDGVPTTSIRWFDSLFATYIDVRPPECTLLGECGTYVVVEHNGDVFSCDFFVDRQWGLGNVLEGRLVEILNSPQQTRFGRGKSHLPRECHACRWLRHCRGGCPKDRWGLPGRKNLNYFCRAYQMFFHHADEQLRRLAEAWLRRQKLSATRSVPVPGVPPLERVGRNAPCPCGSGRKYKHCCGK